MKKEIYRCPYCSERAMVEDIVHVNYDYPDDHVGYAVVCKSCNSHGPTVEGCDNSAKRAAIDKWNIVASQIENSTKKNPVSYEDSDLEAGDKPASEKQIEFATAIAERLHIKLPIKKSSYNLRIFISENVEAFNKKNPRRKSWCDYDDYDDDDYYDGYYAEY